MKKLLFFFALVCALAVPSLAQPAQCTVTGTMYKPAANASGSLTCANCTFRIVRTIKNNQVVSTSPVTVTTTSTGTFSFTVLADSQIQIQGEVYGYQTPVNVNVPASGSCPVTLESLTTATPVISTGLTIKANNSALSANKQGTLDFSSRFALTESPTAETNIDLAASGVTAGTCTNCNLTIDTYGRVTAKANGSGGSGTGLLTLNGLTADPQSFAKADDTNVTLAISSVTDTHTFTMGWTGQLAVARGGTGSSTASGARTNLGLVIGTDVQAFDSDLSAIAALSPANDDVVQRKAGAWTNRTMAQLKTDLSLSGTNTGDQTITLTGDVAGSGTGSFAATIANDAVTFAKMQNIATGRLLGRTTASSGDVEEITPAATFSFSGGSLDVATGGITNAMLAGSIANVKLANSSITIAGTSTSLGGSITLDTITGLSSTGLIKRTGANALAVAASGTDYAPATSGTAILKGSGSGGFSNAAAGTDYEVPLTFSTGVSRSSNTVTLDINGLTEETAIASGDFVAIYDVSASAIRKMTRANFVAGLSGGGGIGSLGGQTGNAQTFSRTNDTNITLTISSATDDHNFALGWTGTLAKARQHASTVYTDQANTFGNFVQTVQASGNFLLSDPTDTTKKAQFDVSNVATSTTRTVNIPNANSTTVQADTGASNQFLTAISAQGVISKAQPSFSNISGSVADGQLSSNVFYVDGTRTGNSSATTGNGFAFDALSITSGIAQRWRVPSSGFTGSILRVTDNAGSPVTLFEIDETGAITTGSIPYSAVSSKSVVNADVNASAAIAYSKLNLSGSIVNADINASAAIADTKLATISTAGKVSDSALSSNVTLGGNTFSGTGSILRATSPTATNATINQAANNNTALTSVRATDTSPTGNFLLFRNAANNTDLWVVDIAGSLTAGDVPAARLSGTIADARFPATLPAVSGANLTNLNASNLASGTVPLARLSGITNTEISGSAAIAYSKLAALTTSRALVSDGSGVISVSSVTATELGHLSGVTSAIQTQLNAKAASSITLTAGVGISGGGDLSANRSFALDLTELVNNQTLWDSSNATRTLTAGLSGATDPVITFGDSSVDVTTGTLKQGGTAVSLAGHAHAASDITSGALAIARGGTGTGTAPSDGKLLIGKTDGTYAVANLTAGSNITITNGDGTVQISSSGGAGGYATVAEEGTGLTQRATLNFVGSAFTAADDSGNSRTNVTSDSDIDALASNSTNGIWARTGSGTGAARTITGTTNQVTVSNGDGVSGNPTLSLPQSIHTAATPQFGALGLGETAPTAGLAITGQTLTTQATNTAGGLDVTSTLNKNDANTRSFSSALIHATLNAGGSNSNTTFNVLEVDTTQTSITGTTVNLLNLKSGGSSVLTVSSGGFVSASVGYQANGVSVPTISSTDTLTNKTMSGSSNTFSNIAATSLAGLNSLTTATPATDDSIPIYDTSATANRRATVTQVVGAVTEGYINGAVLTWSSTTQVQVTTGTVHIQSSGSLMRITSTLTISPSLSTNTWYHCYVFDNAGTPSGECVTTAPASPYTGTARSKTSDTTRRYVGSIRTDGSSQIRKFVMSGGGSYRTILWMLDTTASPFRVLSGGLATTNTNVDLSAVVPNVSSLIKVARIRLVNLSSAAVYVFVDNSDMSGTNPAGGAGFTGIGQNADVAISIPINSSQIIRYAYAGGTPSGSGAFIEVQGYEVEL